MKVAAMAASFFLYWSGHAVSRLFRRWDSLAFMYPVYNRLMCWSADVEDWAGIDFMWSPRLHADSE
jgi:hypothetical protein